MKLFCIFFFFILEIQFCMSQSTKFDTIVNQLYFNVLTVNPDSVIEDYLKKNVPIYARRDVGTEWRLSNLYFDPRLIEYTIDTFIFTSHPFFKEKFKTGNFNFLIKKYQGNFIGVSDMYLVFICASKEEAENVYYKLIADLTSSNTKLE